MCEGPEVETLSEELKSSVNVIRWQIVMKGTDLSSKTYKVREVLML